MNNFNNNSNFIINHKIFIFNLIASILIILFGFLNKSFDSPQFLKLNNQNIETTITKLGDKNVIFTNILALSFLLVKKDYQGLFLYVKTLIPVGLATEGIKRLTKRERPNQENHKSFPSGHSALSFLAFIFLFFRYGIKIALPFLIIALFVGYSRIATNWHYLSDVCAGFLLSYIFTYLFRKKRAEKAFITNNIYLLILTSITVIFNILLLIFLLK